MSSQDYKFSSGLAGKSCYPNLVRWPVVVVLPECSCFFNYPLTKNISLCHHIQSLDRIWTVPLQEPCCSALAKEHGPPAPAATEQIDSTCDGQQDHDFEVKNLISLLDTECNKSEMKTNSTKPLLSGGSTAKWRRYSEKWQLRFLRFNFFYRIFRLKGCNVFVFKVFFECVCLSLMPFPALSFF